MATYTVRVGDSISKIARDMLGTMARWPEIAQLNNITPPYTIFPGQTLQLPGAGAGTDLVPVDPGLYKGAAGKGLPLARAAINWPLIALAIAGVALIWYGTRK